MQNTTATRIGEQFVNRNQEAMLRFLSELIAIHSPSGQEGLAAQRVCAEMEALGYDSVAVDGVGNVLGTMGNGPGLVILSAHLDTAGVADPAAWSQDPYGGALVEGRIYGRGAGDNKGPLAAMVYAGVLARELGLPPDLRLMVAGTVLEEDCDGYGMQYLVEHLDTPPLVVMVAKPTEGRVHRGHRGRMEIRIDIEGKSCHASTPHLGENALYLAAPILSALEQLNVSLKEDAFLGKATLAATRISVKPDSFNSVPGECTICVDRRLTFGETRQSALAEIQAILPPGKAQAGVFHYQKTVWTGEEVSQEKFFPSWSIPEDHWAVQAALAAVKEVTGQAPPVDKWLVSTDGVGSSGRHGIPTVGYAPGQRRPVDDHQEVADLLTAVRVYAAFAGLVPDYVK